MGFRSFTLLCFDVVGLVTERYRVASHEVEALISFQNLKNHDHEKKCLV